MIIANTRTLAAGMTGVPRYVTEILRHFPPDIQKLSPQKNHGGIAGHLWEQSALPRRLGGGLLWSPANTGPLAISNQVVTIHDVVPLDHPEWLNWKFSAWYRFLIPRLVHRVKRIIAISEFTKQRLLATTTAVPEKIIVIPNGVDNCFYPRPFQQIEADICALSLPCRRYVLTVSSLEPRKNLRRLLVAWGQIQNELAEDIWLVVAGAKGKAIVFADDAGIENLPPRVHLTGFVADQLLPSLYAGAMSFVYMSAYEGFGLPPLEAMASGVPVLVSNSTAFPEVVADAGLYAEPSQEDSIAEGLIKLVTDSSLSSCLRARGLKRAKTFSWARTAALTLDVLREAESK